MVKTDLIRRIAERNPDLSTAECRKLIIAFFDAMIEHLARDGDIEIRGFGTFCIKRYGERAVRNLWTGEIELKPEVIGIRFRTGKPLVALLNPT